MNWVDYTIAVIIVLSALLSLVRGFVREFISLLAWVAAFWAALRFGPSVSHAAPGVIESETVRMGLAFLVLFVGTLLVGAVTGRLLGAFVRSATLGGTDRALGVAFGLTRGVLLIAVLVTLGAMTPLKDSDAWHGSWFIDMMHPLVDRLQHWVPGSLPTGVVHDITGAGR